MLSKFSAPTSTPVFEVLSFISKSLPNWRFIPKMHVFQMLGLFPSQNAIAMGDKEYHSAVNIGATMKTRYSNWRHQGW
jgi:hypothetical protein